MELIILGTSAGYANRNDGCSSYILEYKNKYYLIDVGPGSVSYMQNFINYTQIESIFVSHLHADHISDIYTLRYAIYYAQGLNRMKKPIDIYMPFSPKDVANFIKTNIEQEFSINQIKDGYHIDIDNMKIRFLKVNHPVETYAMRFDTDEGSLVYTSDTYFFDDLVLFSRNADLLLAEATLLEVDKDKEPLGHMTSKTAAKLAKEANVNKLILTHIWPENDRLTLLEEAETIFKDVTIAERGERHVINRQLNSQSQ